MGRTGPQRETGADMCGQRSKAAVTGQVAVEEGLKTGNVEHPLQRTEQP